MKINPITLKKAEDIGGILGRIIILWLFVMGLLGVVAVLIKFVGWLF